MTTNRRRLPSAHKQAHTYHGGRDVARVASVGGQRRRHRDVRTSASDQRCGGGDVEIGVRPYRERRVNRQVTALQHARDNVGQQVVHVAVGELPSHRRCEQRDANDGNRSGAHGASPVCPAPNTPTRERWQQRNANNNGRFDAPNYNCTRKIAWFLVFCRGAPALVGITRTTRTAAPSHASRRPRRAGRHK